MRGIYAFFWKGLMEFLARKDALFWTLAFPLIFGLLFAAVFGHGASVQTTPVGVVPESTGNTTMCSIFIENMKNMSVEGKKVFDVKNYSDEDMAISALKRGDIKAVIVFDKNFTENITTGLGQGRLTVVIDKRDPQEYQFVGAVIGTYLRRFESMVRDVRVNITLEYMDSEGNLTPEQKRYARIWMENLADPINTTYVTKVFGTTAKSVRLWYETAAIGVTFVFSGMISSAGMISEEIERGTARRLLNTRTRAYEMIVGNMLVVLILELLSASIIILSFFIIFGDIIPPTPEIMGMLFASALSTISLGLVISTISRGHRAATSAANAIAWPISFITGIFFPEFLLPDWMKVIGDYFPASALLRGVRMVVIYGKGISDYMTQIIIAVVFTLALIAIGAILFRWRMNRE